MNSPKFFRSAIVLTLTIAFVVVVGCSQDEASQAEPDRNVKSDATSIAIKVENESISMAEFNNRLDRRLQRIKQRLKQVPKSQRQKQLNRYRKRFKQQLAKQLETRLTLKHFMKQSGVSVTDKQVNQKFRRIKQQFSSEKTMKQTLKKQGETIQSVKDQIRERLKIQDFLSSRVGEVKVSPEEAEEYYRKNEKEFDKPEKVKARHILIRGETDARKEIETYKERIDQGEDFKKLAREKSEGPSADQGGSLGFITRDRMTRNFSDAAFSLGVGEVSDPVRTQYGWHLIKVEEHKPAESANYEDVSDTVVRRVRAQKRQQKIRELIQELKGKVEIVNNVAAQNTQSPSPNP